MVGQVRWMVCDVIGAWSRACVVLATHEEAHLVDVVAPLLQDLERKFVQADRSL